MGSTLDYSSGRLNSLKRNLNSNGKSNTGVGPLNQNHDNLIDEFVRHTSGGKVYIPSGDISHYFPFPLKKLPATRMHVEWAHHVECTPPFCLLTYWLPS